MYSLPRRVLAGGRCSLVRIGSWRSATHRTAMWQSEASFGEERGQGLCLVVVGSVGGGIWIKKPRTWTFRWELSYVKSGHESGPNGGISPGFEG